MKKLITLLVLAPAVALAGCAHRAQVSDGSGSLSAGEPFVDLGTIAIGGGEVTARFAVTNASDAPVEVTNIHTSCGCTKARLQAEDGGSRYIAMRHPGVNTGVYRTIAPGETATVEAVYDPLFHGPDGLGTIRRSVFVETDSAATPELRLDFQVNVVRTVAEVPAPEPEISFYETEHDFGVLRQSGGIVTHDFEFAYAGDQPITVTGVPASCGCTSAEVSSPTFQPGEHGIVTVSFDPNLHEEPGGRFFKTVSVLTDPPLDPQPELKVWAEIDLDLGPEAYKLKEHTD